ncbi:uncharacterized protein N7477_003707 [Penicillium maclennaniae]|uniref:uncharacterized protein n=1 Tax=Penicillium maclennaniae TaxID=1343394 RepID=UPI0025421BBF|nr:uncharacterized protein N7477_003707 [Penicillium maclennaniae]KAJ5678074.1 hypothetical protein N7477_003707 [Penicillium maclennaniae]
MHQSGQAFVLEADHGEWPVESREIAYWADGSLKWTAHSISGNVPYSKEYAVKAAPAQERTAGIRVQRDGTSISITSNQGLHLQFKQTGGSSILERLDIDENTVCCVVTLHEEWAKTSLKKGLSYIPPWDSYSLTQLSSDGFTIKKRTNPGCSWVKITGGGRAVGIEYIGSAQNGGLAVGMSDFWERYPTQIELDKLSSGTGVMIVWLYSPLAEPLETAPYHDGLALVRDPPRLVATAEHMYAAGVFHGCWSPISLNGHWGQAARAAEVERNLETLFNFYKGQVEQHRWYGFWDYGDVQHTYDSCRHAWRYDVGGFAWVNSELSTDLWLWLYFLHTGRSDVFKMAEAMTRHTGEVVIYHSGRYKGFGTRHGVQHFSDSSKQLRISNVLYRRVYFYLTGDERVGDLISELQDCQKSLLVVDSHRKVQSHAEIPEGFAMTNIGLDCGPLAAAWLTAWKRRSDGWQTCKDLLINLLDGIADLKHGIGNNAILFNPTSGEVRECPRPTPEWAISHLSMLFDFPEIMAELFHYAQEEYPLVIQKFNKVTTQRVRLRVSFTCDMETNSSTLTAFAAADSEPIDEDLATAACKQFLNTDGYTAKQDWRILQTSPPEYFSHGEEASWISTNEVARYGVSALVNLATLGQRFREVWLESATRLRDVVSTANHGHLKEVVNIVKGTSIFKS